MNTLRELAEAIQNNSISESVLQQIGSKVSTEDFEEFKQTLNDLYAPKNHNHDERYVLSSQVFTKQQADNLYQLKAHLNRRLKFGQEQKMNITIYIKKTLIHFT